MAARPLNTRNDSLEIDIEKSLREEQLRRAANSTNDPPRRRKSPFATVARNSHSPRAAYYQPRTSDLDSVATTRTRFAEDTSTRSAEEEGIRPEGKEAVEDNSCLTVALSLLAVVVVCVIVFYSWASASAVK